MADSFRPTFRTAGGINDGIRIRIHEQTLDTALTSRHETIHEKIFLATPDGLVHKTLLLAEFKNRIPDALKEKVSAAIALLYKKSRLAHEAFATYLSIKEFPRTQQDIVLQQHPEKPYIQCYTMLASVFDTEINTSYLQYIVGWSCARISFSSPLIERFDDLIEDDVFILSDVENPSWRLEEILASISKNDLKDLKNTIQFTAHKFAQINHSDYWDVFSEEEWVRRDIYKENLIDINKFLIDAVVEWFQRRVKFDYLDEVRLLRAKKSLQVVAKKIGVTLEFADSEESNIKLLYGVISDELSDTRIINANPVILKKLNSELKDDQLFNEVKSISICSASPPNRHLEFWNLLLWNVPEGVICNPILAREIGFIEVMQFLERWRNFLESGQETPTICSITIAIEGWKDFEKYLKERKRLENFFSPQILSKVCWYWMEPLHKLIAFFANHRISAKVCSFTAHSSKGRPGESYDIRDLYDLRDGNEKLTLTFFATEWNCLFVRILPLTSFFPLIEYLQRLIDDGIFTWMSDTEGLEILPRISDAQGFAQTFFDEY